MFTLDTHRTYKQPVNVVVIMPDGTEQPAEFTAEFKVMPFDEMRAVSEEDNTAFLDKVLVGIEDIELTTDGTPLKGKALLDAAINDPTLALAIGDAYAKSIEKKTPTHS